MLVLTRDISSHDILERKILIEIPAGRSDVERVVEIDLVEARGMKVRVGVTAPNHINIRRAEVPRT